MRYKPDTVFNDTYRYYDEDYGAYFERMNIQSMIRAYRKAEREKHWWDDLMCWIVGVAIAIFVSSLAFAFLWMMSKT